MQSHSRVVDAVFGGGAAALVQFLRSDSLLARGYRVIIGVELRWPNLAKELKFFSKMFIYLSEIPVNYGLDCSIKSHHTHPRNR